ncbi:ribonuclease P protein component [Hoeflea sp.]|uniref:ribonuclease P protein component n=1 Tax=Hoeflea sp. TaxID=1940281 RepID=UPI003B525FBB
MRPGRLKNRPDFLAVQKGSRLRGPYFLLETLDRGMTAEAPRIGYTVTRKQGNAVERNRMRRRLREAVRQMAGVPFKPGHDYVIVARRDTLSAPFDRLVQALSERVLDSTKSPRPGQKRSATGPRAQGNTRKPGI